MVLAAMEPTSLSPRTAQTVVMCFVSGAGCDAVFVGGTRERCSRGGSNSVSLTTVKVARYSALISCRRLAQLGVENRWWSLQMIILMTVVMTILTMDDGDKHAGQTVKW